MLVKLLQVGCNALVGRDRRRPAFFLKPHEQELIFLERCFERELDGFVVDRAACVLSFSEQLQERFGKGAVAVYHADFRVGVVELDGAELDEEVDRSGGLKDLVQTYDQLRVLDLVPISARQSQLSTDNGNHRAMNGRTERAVAVNFFGFVVLFPGLLDRHVGLQVETSAIFFFASFPLHWFGAAVRHDHDCGCGCSG